MSDLSPVAGHPLRGLLVAGSRLGWQYLDPAAAMAPYPYPQPVAPAPAAPVVGAVPGQKLLPRLLITGGLGLGAAVLLGCCGFAAAGPSGSTEIGAQIKLLAVLLALGTVGLIAVIVWRDQARKSRAAAEAGRPQRDYQAALHAWTQHAAAHRAAEQARVGHLPTWQAVGPRQGRTRLDIVGGTQAGWRDLLTVAGAGYLATHGPSTIVDLTGDQLCTDLRDLCTATGVRVDWQDPPADCDLLAGLTAEEIVDVLVEAIHGDGDRELRGHRATDSRILTAVAEALAPQVTIGRIVEALQVLLRLPGQPVLLSAGERAQITDELFPPDYLAAAAAPLQRLEAHLRPLRALTGGERPAATLTIMGGLTAGTTARSELLDDLIVAWVTRRVATRPDLCRTLVVVGADPLAARHVERLADICARHGVVLVLLWRYLRDTAQRALGGGAVAFMRLANADEASRAADHIGRTHRFVLSGLTSTVGGSTTYTETTGISHGVSTGRNEGMSRSGRIGQLIDAAQVWTRTVGSTTGTTTTTSTQTSTATGTTWSDASTRSRVYEYAVEPTVLQGLPDHAVLLVEHGPAGPTVLGLDCNPAIVTLPSVNMQPAAAPAAGIPQQRAAGAVGYVPPSAITLTGPGQTGVPQQRSELWTDRDRP